MGSHQVAIPVRGPNTVFGSASQAVRITRSELWLTAIPRKAILTAELKLPTTVHLTTADSFDYSATVQFFDADGNLVFTGCFRATGTRFE